jgi:hypothetical protein
MFNKGFDKEMSKALTIMGVNYSGNLYRVSFFTLIDIYKSKLAYSL